jgi:hypothetical protein
MSMEEDIEGLLELKQTATMTDAVDDLAKIKFVIAHVVSGGDAFLGPEHLAMTAINEHAASVNVKIDELHAALASFESKVKEIVDDVIQGLHGNSS